jgi:hypothetical protein
MANLAANPVNPMDNPAANPDDPEDPDAPDGATVLELLTRQRSISMPPASAILLRMTNRDMRRNVPMPTLIRLGHVERLSDSARVQVLTAMCSAGSDRETIFKLMYRAAKRGCKAIVRDLKNMYFSGEGALVLNPTMCSQAASGSHIHLLDLFREWGCPWDENTCLSAAFRVYMTNLCGMNVAGGTTESGFRYEHYGVFGRFSTNLPNATNKIVLPGIGRGKQTFEITNERLYQ